MNALVPVQTNQFPIADIERVAEAIAKGGLFGSRDPYAVLTLCLLAQAEGQHPAVVFRDYHIISGKPAKKAEAMLRDFITAGGKIEWHRLDDECADATFSHSSGGSARISWDKARVQQAQLGGNAMHKKYPRQMLRSRVISEGVRTVYPGATSGLYESGEVQDMVQEAPALTHQPQEEAAALADDRFISDAPAPRTKLDGPHTSKTALKKAIHELITAALKCDDVECLNSLLKDNRATIDQADRDWPSLLNGDPNIEEDMGLKGIVAQRRTALQRSPAILLINQMKDECASVQEMGVWWVANEEAIEGLDDAERDRFDTLFNEHESALQTANLTRAG